MDVRVLGHVEAGNGARTYPIGGPTQRRVFAALVARRGEVVDVSALVDVCWPTGSPPDRADHNIRTYVHRLRSSLQDDGERLDTVGTGYRFRLEPGELDVERFEELAGIARRGVATGDTVGALDALDAANALWTGRPYGEFADEPWAIAEVARLTEAHAALDESRAEALLAVGRAADAVVLMERVVRDEPLREHPRALLMRSLYESGRQAEALRAFQDFRRYMIDEAGIDPSPTLVALDRQIASGELAPPDAGPIVGNYELHDRIGEGAFAVVHRATQASLDREVAVKIVRAELANRPEFIRRFEAEAQMVARIEHPHVVPLYDYWREPDRAYLVMRFMSGGSLETRLDAGPWSVEATATLVDQIASALDAAHEAGVVHRDVKPANIMFDDADRAFLGDFGIALSADERARPEAALSEGSPIFASPEQLRREPVGPEADVHALGIVAYTLLAGRTPFADSPDEPTMLRRQMHDPIPSARDHRPELPAALDDVLVTATAKQPSERYPTASAFAEAFRAAGTSTPSSVSAPRALRPRSNPYKGLRAFDETDAADFHGRDRLVDELIDRLARPDHRMLAVVGPSGSGKSSVVRAGLLPALRAGRVPGSSSWFTTTMIPGPRPFEALETALLRVAVNPPAALLDQLRDGDRGILRAVKRIVPDDDGVVVIVIDQFEELFTSAGHEADRDQFLRALTVAATESGSPVRILMTLRADFYDRPLRHPEFAPLLKQHTVVVTPLAPDELEHAIVTPAATVGVAFEPGLVAEIVADVNHEPGALPLLQYALSQVFDATDSDTIKIEQYRAIGGLTGALGRRAEALFRAADTGEQLAAHRLFGRLVALGEGTEDTRRRIRRTELGREPAIAAALDRFGRARLLTFDRDPASREPTVEIAHEALIRGWPRLRTWLDEDRDGLRIHRHLTDTAAAWIGSGRDDGELYRGSRLEAAVAWSQEAGDDLNDAEREFLATSVAAHDAEEDAERAHLEQQVAANRRLRTLVAVVTVIAVLAAAIGIFALQQRNRADDQATEALTQASAADEARQDAEAARADADRNAEAAEAERGRAESSARTAEEEAGAARAAEQQADVERLRAVARSIAPEQPGLGALLAVEAYRQDPSNDSIDVLHRVLTAVPGLRETITVPAPGYNRAELVDDTTLIAAGLTLDLWDLPTRNLRASIELPDVDRPPLLSVSVDGRMAAVATGTDRVTVVDVDAERVLTTFSTDAALTDISIDPAGTAVAVGRQDGTVEVWSLPDATETLQIDVGGEVRLVRWSPSGAAIATVTNTSTVQFWDAASGVERWASSTGDDGNILTAAPTGAIFSPQGDLLVVDSGLLNPILRTYATEDGSVAFPPTRRTDGDTGNDILFWRDAEQHHLAAGTAKNIATYDLANGVEVGERVTEITINDAVFSSSLGEFVAVTNGLIIRAADESGPLETVIPLSDEQRRALDAGGSIHPAIAEDGTRVMLSTFLDADIPAATAFDMTAPAPTPIPAPIDRRMPFGNGAFTMTFGMDPPGFELLDANDEPVGAFPLTFDMIDQDASADGRFVALSHAGGTVDLYTGTGELLHVFDLELPERLSGAIVIPSLTDDGRFLVASGAGLTNNRPIAIWSTETFERIDDDQFAGQTRAAGNLVANRSGGVVRLYSLPDLEQVGEAMLNQAGGQFYPALDADHGRLAVTSLDTVTLYDIATGQQIGRTLPYRPIRIEYSADGSQLVVGSGDRVTVWNYDTDTWTDIACRVAGRNLTRAQWEQLGPRTIEYRTTCEEYPLAD